MFDPFVAIDALMQGGATLLIDGRTSSRRAMQDNASAAVSVPQLRALRRGVGAGAWPKHPLYGALTAAMRALEEAAGTEEFASGRLERPPEALDATMARLLEAADGALPERRGDGGGGGVYAGGLLALCGGAARRALCRADGGNGKNREDRIVLLCAAQDILEKDEAGARRGVFFRDARAV